MAGVSFAWFKKKASTCGVFHSKGIWVCLANAWLFIICLRQILAPPVPVLEWWVSLKAFVAWFRGHGGSTAMALMA